MISLRKDHRFAAQIDAVFRRKENSRKDVDDVEDEERGEKREVQSEADLVGFRLQFDVTAHISEQQKDLDVVHDIKNRVEADHVGVARVDRLDEGKGQIGREVDDGEDEEPEKTFFVLPFSLFQEQIDDMDREDQKPHDAHRRVENSVVRHTFSIIPYRRDFFNAGFRRGNVIEFEGRDQWKNVFQIAFFGKREICRQKFARSRLALISDEEVRRPLLMKL